MKRTPIDWSSKSDEEFVSAAEHQIWLSAFANNNPRAPAHAEADAAYDEAKRRGKPWLYIKAHNRATESCGYSVSEIEHERATEAGYLHHKARIEGENS